MKGTAPRKRRPSRRRWAICTHCERRYYRSRHAVLLPCCKCGSEVVFCSRKLARVRVVLYLEHHVVRELGPRPTLAARWLLESAVAKKRAETQPQRAAR